jgi:hypothetical protein
MLYKVWTKVHLLSIYGECRFFSPKINQEENRGTRKRIKRMGKNTSTNTSGRPIFTTIQIEALVGNPKFPAGEVNLLKEGEFNDAWRYLRDQGACESHLIRLATARVSARKALALAA